MWKILDTGMARAEENMRLDCELLKMLPSTQEPILHLYSWCEDSATYGHFIKLEDFVDIQKCKGKKINFAKRPTGGGIIFHISDWAFSVLVPASHPYFSDNTLKNYAFVNNFVIEAVTKFLGRKTSPSLLQKEDLPIDSSCGSFCMAKPTKYDVIIEGKKIGGAAQRRTKGGFLHQGTISIAKMPDAYLRDILKPGTRVLEAIRHNSFSLLDENWTMAELYKARQEMRRVMIESFTAGKTVVNSFPSSF